MKESVGTEVPNTNLQCFSMSLKVKYDDSVAFIRKKVSTKNVTFMNGWVLSLERNSLKYWGVFCPILA